MYSRPPSVIQKRKDRFGAHGAASFLGMAHGGTGLKSPVTVREGRWAGSVVCSCPSESDFADLL